MTLQSSGAMSTSNINDELTQATYNQISLNDNNARILAEKTTSTISFLDFYGKSYIITSTITAPTNLFQYVLSPSVVTGYVAGKTNVIFNINAGVYVYSDNAGIAALTIRDFVAGDVVKINNNGYIMGRGGDGGGYVYNSAAYSATAGSPAISIINCPVSIIIDNTNGSAYIGGGGGGGGGGGSGGGGGAGGGKGGKMNSSGPTVVAAAGGGLGMVGTDGQTGGAYTTLAKGGGAGGGGGGVAYATAPNGAQLPRPMGGAGGGRIFPGAGGEGGVGINAGGKGGSGSANGTNGVATGGGGGWGASGGSSQNSLFQGAAGGNAVQLNGYSVTFINNDTTRVYGAVS